MTEAERSPPTRPSQSRQLKHDRCQKRDQNPPAASRHGLSLGGPSGGKL